MLRAGALIALTALTLVLFPRQMPSVIGQADRNFSYGEDAGRDRQALADLERALGNDANNYQLLWRVARSRFYAGEEAAGNEKVGHYDRGIVVGERAVASEPNRPEGHFWLGANYGGASEQKGAFKALRMIGKIRAEMEAVIRIAPGYEEAKAYLALSELDRQLPRLLGGSNARALNYGEQGLRYAPNNLELKLSLARAYLEAGRRPEAKRQLEELLARKVNPMHARAERGVQEEARQLLGKM
jgi:tetratricopeptide (TPR) repeat protein